MKQRNRVITMIGAGLLTLTIAATALLAGRPGSTLAAPPAATPTSGQSGQNPLSGFVAKLAANLGITQDQLTAAVKKADLQQINEALAAGQMTADQAQSARDRINNGTGLPPFGVGKGGHDGGRGGPGFGDEGTVMNAAATFFGITTDQLQQDLQSTGSLQGVAAKYGKDNATDKASLEAALEAALRQDLTTKGVAATEIDQRAAQFKQNFDQFYTSGFGHGGQPGTGGPRGPQGSPSASATPGTGR
jgi:hypothetical protein